MTDSTAARLLLAFEGHTLPDDLPSSDIAGFTLFRDHNVIDAGQLRELTDSIRNYVAGPEPLVCIDQEGGQFLGLGDVGTPFPGNMALGATGDTDLAFRVAEATASELRACGINVNYAPVADITTDPANPGLGIRSFGEDPATTAAMVTASVAGFHAGGVAATVKHFPGKGSAAVDSHHGLPVLDHDIDRLNDVELVPFTAGIQAGADLVMTGHFALPNVTGRADLPTTLASPVLVDLLRDTLGFSGVTVSDAFNMAALAQGPGQIVDAIAAMNSGVDLLLLTFEQEMRTVLPDAIALAGRRGLLDRDRQRSARQRIEKLRATLGTALAPDLSVLRSRHHLDLAAEVASRSITLVRNDKGLLPFDTSSSPRIAAVMPRPENLTPADTSQYVAPGLATALRRHPVTVDEIVSPHRPSTSDIAAVVDACIPADLVIVGTISASMNPAQAAMVKALLEAHRQVVTVAMRTPWDLAAYPDASTHLCTYGILEPTMEALADAVFGARRPTGQLPAAIASLYEIGHGIST